MQCNNVTLLYSGGFGRTGLHFFLLGSRWFQRRSRRIAFSVWTGPKLDWNWGDQADGRQAQSPVSNFALDAQFSLGWRLTWADVHSRTRLIATASTSFGFLPLPESYRRSNCCGRSPS